ncbi:MAG: hypothetical protein HQL58_07730 [Magnetococcales bacterium]|nr:hypothetical protein [Magnetococcales bacterium]
MFLLPRDGISNIGKNARLCQAVKRLLDHFAPEVTILCGWNYGLDTLFMVPLLQKLVDNTVNKLLNGLARRVGNGGQNDL